MSYVVLVVGALGIAKAEKVALIPYTATAPLPLTVR